MLLIAASGHSETPSVGAGSPFCPPFVILPNLGPQLNAVVEVKTIGILHMGLALGVLCQGRTLFHIFLIYCLSRSTLFRVLLGSSAGLWRKAWEGQQLVFAARGSPGELHAGVRKPGGLGGEVGLDGPVECQQTKEGHTQTCSLESGSSRHTLHSHLSRRLRDSGHLFVCLLSSADHGAWFCDHLRLKTKALPLPGSEACGLTSRNRPRLTLEAELVSA